MKTILSTIFLLIITLAQAQTQFFHETKSYEIMFEEADLVVEGKDIGNKNVIIQQIYHNDDENFNVGDTLYIGWLSDFELRSPPPYVFLFLKKVDPATRPAYNSIDVKPVSNSIYEHIDGGVIWFDTTGCYRYSDPDHGYTRLVTIYDDEKHPHRPVFAKEISTRLKLFSPFFKNYLQARAMEDGINKEALLVSYLFEKNTPATPFYELFASLELRDPNLTAKGFEYSRAMIPYLEQVDDSTVLTYPLQALKLMEGRYNDFVLPPLEEILLHGNPKNHAAIISIMGQKGDEYAIEKLRSVFKYSTQENKAQAAILLYDLHDKISMPRAKKLLLQDHPDFLLLKHVNEIEHEKTQAFIKEMLKNYKEGSPERKTLLEIK